MCVGVSALCVVCAELFACQGSQATSSAHAMHWADTPTHIHTSLSNPLVHKLFNKPPKA